MIDLSYGTRMNQRWQERSDAWVKGMPFAWLGLMLGIGLSLAIGWTLYSQAVARQVARFESDASRLDAGLVRYLEAELDLLRAAQGFFDAGPVDAAAWKAFVRRAHVRDRYPGLRSLGYLQLVAPAQQPAFAKQMAKDLGFPVQMVPTAGEVAAYARFIEPQLKDPGITLGINTFTEPSRREAILRAIESDVLSATRPLELIGLNQPADRPHAAVVVYLPVYRRGASLATPLERREAAEGVVFLSLLTYQVFEPVLAKYSNLALDVRDEAVSDEESRLFADQGSGGGLQQDVRFQRRVSHELGQRTWVFSYEDSRPNPAALALRATLPYPIAGATLALVFFLLVRSLIRGKARAERLATNLRQSEDRFRRVADQAPCGILLLTDRVKYVNPYFLKSLGYEASEVIGAALRGYVHPEDRHLIPEVEAAMADVDTPLRVELRVLAKDGGCRWMDITMSPLNFGRHRLLLATAFDVTERLRAEEGRLEAERSLLETRKLESLRVLAGGFAHDFNNLLGVVLGNADLAEGQPIPDQNLHALREACLKAVGLTRQLLAFSGGGGMAPSATDLNACVLRAIPRVGLALLPEGRVTVDLALPLAQVLADPALLEQMVLELIENGLEATQDDRGPVSVRTCAKEFTEATLAEFLESRGLEPGPYVSLTVEDRGRGMDAAHLARIFDPFFTTKFVGRGLGLAALLGVVRSHRGAVRVSSEPGQGSTFEVILPVHGTPESAADPSRTSPSAGRGTVLVVDDEVGIRELAVEILQSVDIPVLSATGGRDALAQVAAHRDEISLLLLDMAMPDLSGAEVIRALRVTDPGIRVILSSGYAEEDLRKTLQPGDIVAFLPKPYRLANLVDLVREVLAKPAD